MGDTTKATGNEGHRELSLNPRTALPPPQGNDNDDIHYGGHAIQDTISHDSETPEKSRRSVETLESVEEHMKWITEARENVDELAAEVFLEKCACCLVESDLLQQKLAKLVESVGALAAVNELND